MENNDLYVNEIIEKIRASGIEVITDKEEFNKTTERINEINITLQMLDEKPVVIQENENKKGFDDFKTHQNNNTLALSKPVNRITLTNENSQEIIKKLKNFKTEMKSKEFLEFLKKSFLFTEDKNSKYLRNKDSNTELRISDHCTNAETAIERKKQTSIVIKLVRGKNAPKFRKSPDADVIEFAYYPENLTLQTEKEIIKGLIDWVSKGEYSYTEADEIHQSTRKDFINKNNKSKQNLTMDWIIEKEIDYKNIDQPKDIIPLLNNYSKSPQEMFLSVSLDGSYTPISCRIVSAGTVNYTILHPRDIFREAIKDNAAAIIIAHNHPSGHVAPSEHDKETTKQIVDAGKIMGIKVLDHIITSPNEKDYFSFQEHGMIQNMKKQGITYGFVYDKKIYLNPELMTSNAAVHEYTHLWDAYTQKTNPDLWNKGLNLFKNSSYWNEVISDPNYQNIKNDDNLVLSEIHARICGDIAEKTLGRIAKLDGEKMKLDAIDWNVETGKYIANSLDLSVGKISPKGRDKEELNTIYEFLASPIKDLVNIKNINTKENQKMTTEETLDNELEKKEIKNPYFNLLSEEQKIEVIKDMKINPDLRAEYTEFGIDKGNNFPTTWDTVIPETEWLIEKINRQSDDKYPYFDLSNEGQKRHYFNDVFKENNIELNETLLNEKIKKVGEINYISKQKIEFTENIPELLKDKLKKNNENANDVIQEVPVYSYKNRKNPYYEYFLTKDGFNETKPYNVYKYTDKDKEKIEYFTATSSIYIAEKEILKDMQMYASSKLDIREDKKASENDDKDKKILRAIPAYAIDYLYSRENNYDLTEKDVKNIEKFINKHHIERIIKTSDEYYAAPRIGSEKEINCVDILFEVNPNLKTQKPIYFDLQGNDDYGKTAFAFNLELNTKQSNKNELVFDSTTYYGRQYKLDAENNVSTRDWDTDRLGNLTKHDEWHKVFAIDNYYKKLIFETALRNTKEMGITIKDSPEKEKYDNNVIEKQIKNLNKSARIFKKSLNKLAESNPEFEKQLNLAQIFNKLSDEEISKVLNVLVKTSNEMLSKKENKNKEIVITKSKKY